VFFSDAFYGNTLNPATTFECKQVSDMQQFIWTNRSKQDLAQLVRKTESYTSFVSEYQELSTLIDNEIGAMVRDVNRTRKYQVKGTSIVYEINGTLQRVLYGYETLFAYFKER
jgi:hypothetical protein